MEKRNRNEKIITAIVAGLVLILAVFGSEFRSYGESASTNIENEEVFEIDFQLEDLITEEVIVVEEPVIRTAKLYDKNGGLLEQLIMLEGESMDEVYAGQQFNRAEYLASYGDVSIYQVAE